MGKYPYLSVVIPAYNESKNIKKNVLESVFNYFSTVTYPYEVILVDDGSTDGTEKLLDKIALKRRQVRVIKNPHRGKAWAVTSGVLSAKGEYILFTDFDQATPIKEVKKLLRFIPSFDIVIGSRKSKRKGAPLSRIIMARGFMLIRSFILGLSLEDTQCGFKLFRRKQARELFKSLRLYAGNNKTRKKDSRVTAGFDVELLFLAQKKGFRIKEVPVKWQYVETRRVNPIYDSLEGLYDLLRIKYLDMCGKYD